MNKDGVKTWLMNIFIPKLFVNRAF